MKTQIRLLIAVVIVGATSLVFYALSSIWLDRILSFPIFSVLIGIAMGICVAGAIHSYSEGL